MTKTITFKKIGSLACGLAILGSTVLPVSAQTYERVYNASTHRYVYVAKPTMGQRVKNFFKKPVVQKTAIGSAAGIGVGAIAGESVLKGGLAGAGAGLGYHLVDRSKTLQREPLARRTLKGGIIGTGVGIAAGSAILPAVAIGAGIGAGVHYTRKYILDRP